MITVRTEDSSNHASLVIVIDSVGDPSQILLADTALMTLIFQDLLVLSKGNAVCPLEVSVSLPLGLCVNAQGSVFRLEFNYSYRTNRPLERQAPTYGSSTPRPAKVPNAGMSGDVE